MSSSLSRSTIEVRQFSFCELAAALASRFATTSTIAAGLPAGAPPITEVFAFAAACSAAAAPVAGGIGVRSMSSTLPAPASKPSLSRILLKKPMSFSL